MTAIIAYPATGRAVRWNRIADATVRARHHGYGLRSNYLIIRDTGSADHVLTVSETGVRLGRGSLEHCKELAETRERNG